MRRILLTILLIFGIGKAGAQKMPEKKNIVACTFSLMCRSACMVLALTHFFFPLQFLYR